MRGPGAAAALVLLGWAAGWAAVAGWTQSWGIVRRGHFRITAWVVVGLAAAAWFANGAAVEQARITPAMHPVDLVPAVSPEAEGVQLVAVTALAALCFVYLLAQYARRDVPGAVAGYAVGAAGVAAFVLTARLLDPWPVWLAGAQLVAGAALLGGVSNGMLLGHWYLNQPGLKTWALERLTTMGLIAVLASGALGLLGAGRLARAPVEGGVAGAALGADLGLVLYVAWLGLLAFTGALVWMARRCVKIRSIQSATGLYYVAILTAGVAEFIVRYLMVSAA